MTDAGTLAVLAAAVLIVGLVVFFLFQRSVLRRPPALGAAAGLMAYVDGDRASARRLLGEALADPRTPVESILLLGRLLREDGEFERARRLHSGLLARPGLDPERRRLVELAVIDDLLAAGSAAEALARTEALLRHYHDPELLERRALALHRTGRPEDACDARDRAAALDRRRIRVAADYRAEWARQELLAGRPESAGRAARRAVERDGTSAAAWLALGEAQRAEGEAERALQTWLRGLRAAPGSGSRLLAPILDLALGLGRVERLLEELEAIRAEHPEDPWLARGVADLRLRRGDREAFLALLADPDWSAGADPAAWAGWVRHLHGRGDDEALRAVLARLPESFGPRLWRCPACGAEEGEARAACMVCGTVGPLQAVRGGGVLDRPRTPAAGRASQLSSGEGA